VIKFVEISRICQRILLLKLFWVQLCANFPGGSEEKKKKKEAGEGTLNG
jgi:hypothetical protein